MCERPLNHAAFGRRIDDRGVTREDAAEQMRLQLLIYRRRELRQRAPYPPPRKALSEWRSQARAAPFLSESGPGSCPAASWTPRSLHPRRQGWGQIGVRIRLGEDFLDFSHVQPSIQPRVSATLRRDMSPMAGSRGNGAMASCLTVKSCVAVILGRGAMPLTWRSDTVRPP
jgi:hypothetical protein